LRNIWTTTLFGCQGKKKKKAKQRQRPEQNSQASTFGASNLPVEGASPSQNDNPPRRKKTQQQGEVQGVGIAGSEESKCKDLFATWVWAKNEVPMDRMEAQDGHVSLQLIQFWGNNF